MENTMHEQLPTLMMTELVYTDLREAIFETSEGVETGVTLFGARQDGCRVALFAVGPGPNTIRTPVFHKPDADHLNREFERLKESYPALEWIGSLHVHPFGMPGLSGHDHRTVAKLLALHPEPLYLPDFIAGIIQRCGPKFAIYPYFFEAGDTYPWLLPVQILPQDGKSAGLGVAAGDYRQGAGRGDLDEDGLQAEHGDRLGVRADEQARVGQQLGGVALRQPRRVLGRHDQERRPVRGAAGQELPDPHPGVHGRAQILITSRFLRASGQVP